MVRNKCLDQSWQLCLSVIELLDAVVEAGEVWIFREQQHVLTVTTGANDYR